MRFMNVIDEQGRFVRLSVYKDETGRQEDSHTFSYAYCREMYQKMGEVMGLEKELEEGKEK